MSESGTVDPMDLTPLVPEGRQIIESYGDGGFKVSGIAYTGPIIVFPERCIAWPGALAEDLSVEMLTPIFDGDDAPEILLLGCGSKIVFISPNQRAAIRARGPVVDAMDTGAACRTYNILMTEERRVAAALIPVG
jgi:uncharacterized protein